MSFWHLVGYVVGAAFIAYGMTALIARVWFEEKEKHIRRVIDLAKQEDKDIGSR